jgi:hypothetical protein
MRISVSAMKKAMRVQRLCAPERIALKKYGGVPETAKIPKEPKSL